MCIRDSLYLRASLVELAAGQTTEGRRLRARAAELNPYYEAFHVHR